MRMTVRPSPARSPLKIHTVSTCPGSPFSSPRTDLPFLSAASWSVSPTTTIHTFGVEERDDTMGTSSYFDSPSNEKELPWPLTAVSLPLPTSSPLPHDIPREADGCEDANASDTSTDAATDVAHTVAGSKRLEGIPEMVSWICPPSTTSLPVQCSSRSRRPIRRKMAAARNKCSPRGRAVVAHNNLRRVSLIMRETLTSPRRDDPRHRRHSVLPSIATRLRSRAVPRNFASYCGTIWQLPTYLAPEDNVIKWGREILRFWTLQRPTPRLIHIGTCNSLGCYLGASVG